MKRKVFITFIVAACIAVFLLALPVAADEQDILSGTCGDNLTWVLEDGVLTISGTGAMEEYASDAALPWYEIRNQITEVIISDGVTEIGRFAFVRCQSIKKVTIADSVVTVGEASFQDCVSLKYITVGSGVTKIMDCAFDGCTGLEEIAFSGSFPDLSGHTFRDVECCAYYPEGNSSWKDRVTLGDKVYLIEGLPGRNGKCGENVTWKVENGVLTISGTGPIEDYLRNYRPGWFRYIGEITRLVVEDGVTAIGSEAFLGCKKIKIASIAESVTEIDFRAFQGCSDLVTVTLPSQMTVLSESVFGGCTSLTEITIPAAVAYVDFFPFDGCTSLTDVYMLGDMPRTAMYSWGANITGWYPGENETWIESEMEKYKVENNMFDDGIVWKPYYNDTETTEPPTTEPPTTEPPTTEPPTTEPPTTEPPTTEPPTTEPPTTEPPTTEPPTTEPPTTESPTTEPPTTEPPTTEPPTTEPPTTEPPTTEPPTTEVPTSIPDTTIPNSTILESHVTPATNGSANPGIENEPPKQPDFTWLWIVMGVALLGIVVIIVLLWKKII